MIITLDGPAASGKSTVARLVAHSLGFYHLNSGLLYRAVTYILLDVFKYDQKKLKAVVEGDLKMCVDQDKLVYEYDQQEGPRVFYNGKIITPFLKTPEIDRAVSLISPQKHVRETLSMLQRALAKQHDIVVEGRDVGSVVFPDAQYKFYLTASLKVRAGRWQLYQSKKGISCSFENAQETLNLRDTRDKDRSISPLVIPTGAIVIDNTDLSLDETVAEVLKFIKN